MWEADECFGAKPQLNSGSCQSSQCEGSDNHAFPETGGYDVPEWHAALGNRWLGILLRNDVPMAQRRLSIRMTREIPHLKHEAVLTQRQIARCCGVSQPTVGNYPARVE